MTNQKEVNQVLVQELKETKTALAKCQQSFEVEKNIKNGLYFFILKNDLLNLLRQFRKTNDYQNEDYHIKSLEFLIENLA
ncbi:hypothetical protein [uncultured Kordia sp.]|uniref:hypothetical protein n=1 Tax=uncultured Kordia sp. TaxID=507699 RepID=UPI002624CE61|nr:hypothetical protein [uncultured Kordia sp.]